MQNKESVKNKKIKKKDHALCKKKTGEKKKIKKPNLRSVAGGDRDQRDAAG